MARSIAPVLLGLAPTNTCSYSEPVGFNNPAMPWTELERRLSDGRAARVAQLERRGRQPGLVAASASPTSPPARGRRGGQAVPYAELHCHSNFSFLDGASHPEELAEEAARLGLEALALTDHDGFYGVVRFAEAARAVGLPTVFGAELTLGARPRPRTACPTRRATTCSCWPATRRATPAWPGPSAAAQLAGEKGAPRSRPSTSWPTAAARRPLVGAHRLPQGHGARRARGATARPRPAGSCAGWSPPFGRDHVAVELWDHGDPLDSARNDALAELAVRAGRRPASPPTTSTTPRPARRPLATALAAVRARRSLDELDRWLPAGGRRPPALGGRAGPPLRPLPRAWSSGRPSSGRACAFDLRLVAPDLPPFPCPDGLDEMSYLRQLVAEGGAARRYGPAAERRAACRRAYGQIDHELDVIEQLGFPGYFLVVWDIVEFCRAHDIYCQGRGSARPTSAVCYALGITNADAVSPRPAVRALPVARARRPARHRPRHRERPPRGGHPVRLRALRPPPRRPGGQRHHLPGQVGGARHGQGARLRPRPAGRLVASRSTPGAGWRPPGPARPDGRRPRHPRRRARPGRARSSTSPATSASTRAAW